MQLFTIIADCGQLRAAIGKFHVRERMSLLQFETSRNMLSPMNWSALRLREIIARFRVASRNAILMCINLRRICIGKKKQTFSNILKYLYNDWQMQLLELLLYYIFVPRILYTNWIPCYTTDLNGQFDENGFDYFQQRTKSSLISFICGCPDLSQKNHWSETSTMSQHQAELILLFSLSICIVGTYMYIGDISDNFGSYLYDRYPRSENYAFNCNKISINSS